MGWTCPNCREAVEEGFDACWNCGTAADGTAEPAFAERRAEVESGRKGPKPYTCAKCGSRKATTSAVRMTEGLMGAVLNWQTATFTAVSCESCAFTEFYRCEPSKLDNFIDLVAGR